MGYGSDMSQQPFGDGARPRDPQESVRSEISRQMVRLYNDQFGRGPTKARIDFAGPVNGGLHPRAEPDSGGAKACRDGRTPAAPGYEALLSAGDGRRISHRDRSNAWSACPRLH